MDKSEKKFLIGFIIIIIILMVGGIFIFSQNPPADNSKFPDSELIDKDSKILGSKDAKVTIVEFSDYECPACALAHPVIKQVLAKNKDKVRFVYRHFPLPQHPDAQKASEAAFAAGSQGKYWEMHDKLFENQKNLKIENLIKYGLDLKLDIKKFTEELTKGKYTAAVQKDLDAGYKVGINATPTFFINGVKMTDPPTLENFQKEIDKVK